MHKVCEVSHFPGQELKEDLYVFICHNRSVLTQNFIQLLLSTQRAFGLQLQDMCCCILSSGLVMQICMPLVKEAIESSVKEAIGSSMSNSPNVII